MKKSSKPKPLTTRSQQNGRTHRFPTVQVRIGEDCYNRFLRYCRAKNLFVSQTLTDLVTRALDHAGVAKK